MTAPIAWTERAGRLKGFVGKVEIFDVSIIGGARPWIMRCQLPAYQKRTWRIKEPGEAKVIAERIYGDWLKAAGFTL